MVQEMRSSRPARRERSDARANRRRLLDAARAAFAEHGDRISVNEVARAAGVGVGTLYRKYPTKADLLVALLMELHEELTAEIAERTAAKGGPEAALRGLVEAHLVVLGRVGPLDAMLRREAPAVAERVGSGQLTERFMGPLRHVLAHGVSQGVFRSDLDIDLVCRAFFGMLDSSILIPRVERDGVEPVARQCTAILLSGIAAG